MRLPPPSRGISRIATVNGSVFPLVVFSGNGHLFEEHDRFTGMTSVPTPARQLAPQPLR